MNDFYQFLFQKLGNLAVNYELKEIRTLVEQSLIDKKKLNLSQLKKKLLTFEVLNQKCQLRFTCFFDRSTTILYIKISNSKTNEQKQYTKKGFTTLENRQNLIGVEQLFYILKTSKKGEVNVTSLSSVSFFDQASGQWHTIQFHNMNSQTSRTQEICEVQQLVEAEDVGETEEIKKEIYVEQAGNCSLYKVQPKVNMEKSFPFYCIGQVEAGFSVYNQPKTIFGVGSLIASDLVLTCAHLIRSTLLQGMPRFAAERVYFILGGERYKAVSWDYPKKFIEERFRKTNDFALLRLSKQIKLNSYLSIAKNYRSNNKISLINIKHQKNDNGNFKSEQIAEQSQIISNENILAHSFKTQNGYSGSPIIVRLRQQSWLQYIVAIHFGVDYSQNDKIGLSIKMTEEVVEKLIEMETKLRNNESSSIKLNTIEFERCLQKAVNVQIDHQKFINEFTARQKQQLQQYKTTWKMQNQYILTTSRGNRISFGELRQKVGELILKYYDLKGKYPPQAFEISQTETLAKSKQELIKQIQSFKEKWLITLDHKIVGGYLSYFDNKLSFLKTGKKEKFVHIKQDFKRFISQYRQNQSISNSFGVDIVSLVLKKKFNSFQFYQNEMVFIDRQIQCSKLLAALGNITKELFNIQSEISKSKEDCVESSLWQQRANSVQFRRIELQQQFPPSFISPFKAFRCNGYYQGNRKYYQFELQVQFEKQQHLNIFLWQQIEFVHQNYLLCYPKEITVQNGFPTLRLKFRTQIYSSLLDFMILNDKHKIEYLIATTIRITDFICDLHSQKFYLCTPIEYCLFYDKSTNKLKFFFFSHPHALYHKINKLKQKFDLMSRQEVAEVSQYYPVQQILSSKNNQTAFDEIDVWMLGKSFQRMYFKNNFLLYNTKYLSFIFDLVRKMVSPIDIRITMEEVKASWINFLQNLSIVRK